MAEYTRIALLEMCDLDEGNFNILSKKPFKKPIGCWTIVKYLRGKLIGESDQLAAKGNAHPFMRWKHTISNTSVDKNGKYSIKLKEDIIPELGQGISFQPISREVWQAD